MKFIMNFLRSPFQFRSSDHPSRKIESDSPIVENMFIDPTTGLATDSKWRAASPGIGSSSSISGSPRLQHRVPGFENNGNSTVEGMNETSVSQNTSNEDGEKTQRVRVVPIKVESVDDSGTPKKRSNVFHSNSGTVPRSNHFGPLHPNFEDFHNRKRHSSGPAVHKTDTTESKPKVCNIPIFVEGRDSPVVSKISPQSNQNVSVHNIPSSNEQPETVKLNGGNLAKCSSKPKCNDDGKQGACDYSLKQISAVLTELQSLKTAVSEFSGVPQDKQYRYLDEMLTRCMLKLDDVETHGNEEVRASRKAAIKAVQECINVLESHCQTKTSPSETAVEQVSSSDIDDTKEEIDVPKADMCENIQEVGKSSDEANSRSLSAVNEQSVGKGEFQQKSLCLNETIPVESKPVDDESSETMAGIEEYAETVAKDENRNFEQTEVVENKPVDMEVVETVTEEHEKPEVKAQLQDQPLDGSGEHKTSTELAETVDELMNPVKVTCISSQSVIPGDLLQQGEPMDSEVPGANVKLDSDIALVKDEVMDSEMVELTKEPVTLEGNKDSQLETK